MKLLLFSDLHCDADAARKLVDRAADVDVLIGAGDFATCRNNIEIVIDILKAVDKPTILVPGNGESVEELQAACSGWAAARVLHGNGTEVEGISFFGIGGAVPVTPFGDWSYDFTEEQAGELLADCPAGGVLISHSPPFGVCDEDSNGKVRGSATVRDVVLEMEPQLVVCGHIHSSWEMRGTLGNSTVINAGPRGVEWELA